MPGVMKFEVVGKSVVRGRTLICTFSHPQDTKAAEMAKEYADWKNTQEANRISEYKFRKRQAEKAIAAQVPAGLA